MLKCNCFTQQQRSSEIRKQNQAEFDPQGVREVDLVQKNCLRNPFRRYEILSTKQVIYAAH